MTKERNSSAALLFAFVAMSVAVAGYFTGLQAPMKASSAESSTPVHAETVTPTADVGVVPATHYSDMALVTRAQSRHQSLSSLKSSVDPLAEIKIEPQDKRAALQQREQNRAFNGAPPTIPHPIDQRSDASCVACHSEGVLTKTLRLPRMSHAFLANCTQCHVENHPQHAAAAIFRENQFTGLAAPTGGPRAFENAPPQIPHSTWMRSDCLSCHGPAGRHGLRTTHPWRHNCQQCHTPSATMDQTLLVAEPQFLPGPEIRK